MAPPIVTSSESGDDTNRESRPSSLAEMRESASPVEHLSSLSNPHICEECEKILIHMNDITPFKTGSEWKTRRGTIRLRDTIQKSSTCHLCAYIQALYRLEEQETRLDDWLLVSCKWDDKGVKGIYVDRRHLSTEPLGRYSLISFTRTVYSYAR